MHDDIVVHSGRMGWAAVATIAVVVGFGYSTAAEPLLEFPTRTGVLTSTWVVLHGLLLLGVALTTARQRLPRRPAAVLGLAVALLSAVGVASVRVAAEAGDHLGPMVIIVGTFVVLLGLGTTMLVAGATGGWLGSLLSYREPTLA